MRILKRLVEKLYYKAYPDRVNEHLLAQTPILIKRYNSEKIVSEIHYPANLTDFTDDWIKHELAYKCAERLKDYITIEKVENNAIPGYNCYQGYIRIVKED